MSKKLSGRLLLFDVKDANGNVFSRDCKIDYPEKVPVVLDFKFSDPNAVIGNASVRTDDEGLLCDVNLLNFDIGSIKNFGIGGYYGVPKSHCEEDGTTVIDEARLFAVSFTDVPVHDEYKVMLVEEES